MERGKDERGRVIRDALLRTRGRVYIAHFTTGLLCLIFWDGDDRFKQVAEEDARCYCDPSSLGFKFLASFFFFILRSAASDANTVPAAAAAAFGLIFPISPYLSWRTDMSNFERETPVCR